MKTLKKLNLKTLSSARVLEDRQMKEIRGGEVVVGNCGDGSCSGACEYLGSRGSCGIFWGGVPGWGFCGCEPAK